MENGGPVDAGDSPRDADSVEIQAEAARGREHERRLEIRQVVGAAVEETVSALAMMKEQDTDIARLSRDPVELATAVVDLKSIQRYTLYGLCIVGFFVWILLNSRGRY